MNLPFWIRRAHRWIGLVIGVQAMLWTISGAYMTAISWQEILGEPAAPMSFESPDPQHDVLGAGQLAQLRPGFESFTLRRFLGRQVFEVRGEGKAWLIDARTGELLSPLRPEQVAKRAEEVYSGKAEIREVMRLTQVPSEMAKWPAPMWAVRFSDRNNTTLYFSPDTGELLAHRHDPWRWFNFLWMFHIMDYEKRIDVNNGFLRVAGGVALVFALSGAWLAFYSFRRRTQA